MKLPTISHSTSLRSLTRSGPSPKLRDWFGGAVEEAYLVTRMLGIGQAYRMMASRLDHELAENPPLAEAPPVSLDRPVVLVPGWKTLKDAFQPLAEKLIEGGRNGGRIVFVSEGEFYLDRDCTEKINTGDIPVDQKVFEVVYSDIRNPPPVGAVELDQNLNAIKGVTRFDKLDVSAYSMGGLTTRVYLDNGGDKIGKLMLLGTPNQGTNFANLASEVYRRDISWALSLAGLLPADVAALNWLSVDNPDLIALNQNWPRQQAAVESVLTVGGRGVLTPSENFVTAAGDGLVEVAGLAPPGGEVRVLGGKNHHGHLNNDLEVYQTMMDYFGWAS